MSLRTPPAALMSARRAGPPSTSSRTFCAATTATSPTVASDAADGAEEAEGASATGAEVASGAGAAEGAFASAAGAEAGAALLLGASFSRARFASVRAAVSADPGVALLSIATSGAMPPALAITSRFAETKPTSANAAAA